jgi:Uma2 family endonuclease
VTAPAALHRYTYREYLRLEQMANVRHEYLAGEIYAMAGGTREHAAICVNVSTALNVQLRGRRCAMHSSDLRVRVLETGLATYPDVTVVCGRAEADADDASTIINPVLVVEVLSPSTQDYDRGEKLAHYQRIASLREVVLVAHDTRLLQIWRLRAGGAWACEEIHNGVVKLESVDASLNVDDVYRDELA